MTTSAVFHDHIVLLLEKEEFETPPAWLTQNFNIIEGGTHTGGSSRNKLIVFKDGTYLELFNWIKSPVEFLDWAQKAPGLIDFALTTATSTTPEENHEMIQNGLSKLPSDLDLGVAYSQPKAGARKRADGIEVQWKAFRPVLKSTSNTPDAALFPQGRIDVPFFCHDVTERNVRVQYDNDKISTHPCGALGIHSVQVIVPDSHVDAYLALYTGVLRSGDPVSDKHETSGKKYMFEVGVPHPVDADPTYVEIIPAKHGARDSQPSSVGAEDSTYLMDRGVGIRGITLRASRGATEGEAEVSLGRDEIGRTIKLKG